MNVTVTMSGSDVSQVVYPAQGVPGRPARPDLSIYVAGAIPVPNKEVWAWQATGAAAISVASSNFRAAVAATAQSIWLFKLAGVTVLTVTYAIGATTPTVTGSDFSIAEDQLFQLFGPATLDATLDGVSFALAGRLV